MNINAWLTEIKIGDTVVICRSDSSHSREVREVTRVTRTQIILEYGNVQWRFRLKDGLEPGTGYHRAWLQPYTPEVSESIALETIRRHTYAILCNIRRDRVFTLTLAQCQQVLDALSQVGLLAQKVPAVQATAH